jgi:HEPN domain-containing protein
MFLSDRSSDWLAQSKRDLEHSAKDVHDGYYEHACFEAQQAAEKAVKAVYQRLHSEAWGHRVAKLLTELTDLKKAPPVELVDAGKVIEKNDEVHYGYKDHVKADKDNKLIVDYTVTDASVHDSQELRNLVDKRLIGKVIAPVARRRRLRGKRGAHRLEKHGRNDIFPHDAPRRGE